MSSVLLWWSLHTKKVTAWHSHLGGYFGLFLGSFWCMFQYFLRTVQYFSLNFIQMFLIYSENKYIIFFHVMPPWAPLWCMFVGFLRIVRYFLMTFCIDVFSTTLMVTALKRFIRIIYFSVGGHFRVFLGQLY